MKKRILLTVVAVVLFCFVLYIIGLDVKNSEENITLPQTDFYEVCFNSLKCFNVEIADDSKERQKGLMFRESLKEDSGMLFVFEQRGQYSFWMKNTSIPLDMIWIDEESDDNFYVSAIISDARPCDENITKICPVYEPGANAKYVLELNANSTKKNGIEVGDEVEIKIDSKL